MAKQKVVYYKGESSTVTNKGYGITKELLEAFHSANIIEHVKQESAKGYLRAMGNVPSKYISIRLVM